jgi:hypothetical protein
VIAFSRSYFGRSLFLGVRSLFIWGGECDRSLWFQLDEGAIAFWGGECDRLV